jgi:hypothetical protein
VNSNQTFHDPKTDTKVVLASLWTAMLFIFAYVDIFGFWRADVIQGALDGEVPGPGITINQAFLAGATGFIVIPTLMIAASLVLKASLNRKLNIGVSIVYAIAIAVLCIGESWIYYLVGSFLEVVLLLAIARTAWAWPRIGDASFGGEPSAAEVSDRRADRRTV